MPSKAKIVFDDHDEAAGIITEDDGKRVVDIHEFDLNKMHPFGPEDLTFGVKIVVCGKPGRGKTRVIEHIMLYKSWMCPVAQAFSGSENVNGFYAERMTPITVFNELDMKALEDFAKRQHIAKQYLPCPWAFQVIDDCADDPSVFKKAPIPSYYRKGRHWAMIHVDAAQYPMDIPSGMRSCIDYIFIMQNSIISERKKLYENFASGAIPTFKDFCDLMDQITEDHTALVVDNTSTSSIISDRVFFFKADLGRVPKGFKMGAPEAWAFHAERMDPSFQESYL